MSIYVLNSLSPWTPHQVSNPQDCCSQPNQKLNNTISWNGQQQYGSSSDLPRAQFPALLRTYMRKHVASTCLDSHTQRSTQMCLQGSASAEEALRPWEHQKQWPQLPAQPAPGCSVGWHSRPSRSALGLTSHFRSFQFLRDLSLHPSHLPQPCHSPVPSHPFYTTVGPQCHSPVSSHLLHYSWTPMQYPELQSHLQEAPLLTWMNKKAQKPPGYCNSNTLSSLSHLLPGYWHPKETQRERKPLTVSPLPIMSQSAVKQPFQASV